MQPINALIYHKVPSLNDFGPGPASSLPFAMISNAKRLNLIAIATELPLTPC